MEHKTLISELTQGKELALQLRTHLHPPTYSSSSSSPQPTCLFLTQMIQSSFEKALLLLNHQISFIQQQQIQESSSSKINKRKNITKNTHVFKKRKLLLPRWTEEVKVCNGTTPEAPLNDGYSWRKYGQKDIHAANFPRCYYRCTHRNVRGCLATKQVQRSDNDPNIFEVTYRGRHTCNQSSNLISSQNQICEDQTNNQIQQNPDSEIMFNFEENNDFNIKTEDLEDNNVFPSFSFSYEPMMDPAFISDGGSAVSPSVSDTAWDLSAYNDEGLHRVQSSEQSEMTAEIISATTSVTNSPIYNGDWDFSLHNIDFDQNFPFDSLDFIS